MDNYDNMLYTLPKFALSHCIYHCMDIKMEMYSFQKELISLMCIIIQNVSGMTCIFRGGSRIEFRGVLIYRAR